MQERATITRAAVLRAAADLFDTKGFAATSINEVVDASGRTSGAVYFHFRSKDRLALAVVEAYHAHWSQVVSWFQEAQEPVLVRIVGLSLSVGRAYRDDSMVRAGARLWFERGAIAQELPTPFHRWITVTEDLLRQAAAGGELLAHLDLARTARVLVSAFFGTHTVTDALGERGLLEDRVGDLWLTILAVLTSSDPQRILADARALDARALDALPSWCSAADVRVPTR
ncbi:ScbR family autoregulator-binding transcription factor [Streptacidiphilus sp. PAMC 29251]